METTSSGQPILRENEKDILIDQMVGLYHNKSKVLNRQRGRIFLTSQRIIYVDNSKPTKNSVSLELDDIDSIEYSSKFLKRSARLILFMKSSDTQDIDGKSKRENTTTSWVCPICMITNETKGVFTKDTDPPPICVNCGVPADYEMTKASINISHPSSYENSSTEQKSSKAISDDQNSCPACTFINHPQISNCEVCGTRLPNVKVRKNLGEMNFKDSRVHFELEHPTSKGKSPDSIQFVQLSFRKSDGLLFAQATEKVLDDLKKAEASHIFNKNLVSINGVSVNNDDSKNLPFLETKLSRIGIASLEKSRETQLLKNDILFNNALTDLNKLMSLATDIEMLYSGHKNKLMGEEREIQKPLLIIDREKFCNRSLFLDEIAREIYGFAISEFKDNKERLGYVMVTLVDLYAMYNKSMRIGTGLISPQEMREACARFEQLNLNELRLTKINRRVLCLSSNDSFEFLKRRILDLTESANGCDLLQLTQQLNEGTASSWTIGILMEVLQSCVDKGDLVIDQQVSGICYYKNYCWPVDNSDVQTLPAA